MNVVGIMIGVDCSITWADLSSEYKLNSWGQVAMISEKSKLSSHEIYDMVEDFGHDLSTSVKILVVKIAGCKYLWSNTWKPSLCIWNPSVLDAPAGLHPNLRWAERGYGHADGTFK